MNAFSLVSLDTSKQWLYNYDRKADYIKSISAIKSGRNDYVTKVPSDFKIPG